MADFETLKQLQLDLIPIQAHAYDLAIFANHVEKEPHKYEDEQTLIDQSEVLLQEILSLVDRYASLLSPSFVEYMRAVKEGEAIE